MNDLWQAVMIVGVLLVLFAFAGAYIAGAKGRPAAEGAAFGFLLGPIGLLIVAMMPSVAARPAEVARQSDAKPEPEPEPKPAPKPQAGRINATARDDYLADALLEFRLRTEAESGSESDPTSTPRRPSGPSRDLRA